MMMYTFHHLDITRLRLPMKEENCSTTRSSTSSREQNTRIFALVVAGVNPFFHICILNGYFKLKEQKQDSSTD